MRIRLGYTIITAVVVLSVSWPLAAPAQDTQPCRKGEPATACYLKFGQVRVQLENDDDRTLRRAIVFSDDMKRDAQDFPIAVGSLMLSINPHSTADERGDLLNSLLVTSKSSTPIRWSGYLWQLSYSRGDAIRVIAERK